MISFGERLPTHINEWLVDSWSDNFSVCFFRLPRVFCTKHGLVKSGEETVMSWSRESPNSQWKTNSWHLKIRWVFFSRNLLFFQGSNPFYSIPPFFRCHFFKRFLGGYREGWVLDIPNGCSMRPNRISRGWFSTWLPGWMTPSRWSQLGFRSRRRGEVNQQKLASPPKSSTQIVF